jgi:hypothetical protein
MTGTPQGIERPRTEHSIGSRAPISHRDGHRPRHRGERVWRMMPLERTGAFTFVCVAALLIIALAMVFFS